MLSRRSLSLVALLALFALLSGPVIAAPQSQPAASLNPQGGTLDGSKLQRDMWIAIEVTAPRAMTVVSFEIFSKTLTGPTQIPAALVITRGDLCRLRSCRPAR
jgi:hypothetical protein